MSLLSVKTRVLQHSIEKIEANILGSDFEDKETDNYLVWRKKSIRSEEIWDITQYDADRCIVELYDGRELLVKEQYEKLHAEWQEARKMEFERRTEEDLILGEEEIEDDENED